MPLVTEVREGGDEGKPIVIKNPESESAIKFRELARSVAQAIVLSTSGPTAKPSLEIGSFS